MLLVLLASRALSQETAPAGGDPAAPALAAGQLSAADPTFFPAEGTAGREDGRLAGNHNFSNFIGFIGNPLENIDPRAVTAIYPLFGSSWVSNTAPIPNADGQVYGPGITVALSERLAVGVNQGGYAHLDITRNESARSARFRQLITQFDPQGRFRDVEAGGERNGFLNVGGFLQYTLIENVKDQFLLTGGVRWVAPCGSHEVFQGMGPALMAPYFTAGKEWGEFHVLATSGFQFPFAGSGKLEKDVFYTNIHLDRRCFGCLYPLVEFNLSYHTSNVSFGLATREGFIDFGNFQSQGNVLTMAVGANVVLIKERLEFGAVYGTVLASQHDFEANSLLVKMMLRY
ncbi:MAG: hypothetical protein ACJ8FY_12310 [Gemmataceae bacterium]